LLQGLAQVLMLTEVQEEVIRTRLGLELLQRGLLQNDP
jgi:hypothetical protein